MQPATILPDQPDEAAEPVTNERRPRCRRLVTIKNQNRALAIRLGPPAREQCTQEVVDPYHESKLCSEHLSGALRDLTDSGVVVILAELPDDLREKVLRHLHAREIVQQRIDDGRLVRLPSGGLIEAERLIPEAGQ